MAGNLNDDDASEWSGKQAEKIIVRVRKEKRGAIFPPIFTNRHGAQSLRNNLSIAPFSHLGRGGRTGDKKGTKKKKLQGAAAAPNPIQLTRPRRRGRRSKRMKENTRTGPACVCATHVLADVPALLPRRIAQEGMPGRGRKRGE